MQVYVRRWCPSEFLVDPTKELSEISGVPVDAISVAKYLRLFPAEISRLDIENELEWNQASLDN
uniref:Ubiquitin carboxyl-terminal hydrolase 47 C-terminal domain-containing protein n=1 Tax=Amphimedon queenslandica TaxID=400682 RepID=A0A1X7UUV3_AMPQE